jgi:hypothetical protein
VGEVACGGVGWGLPMWWREGGAADDNVYGGVSRGSVGKRQGWVDKEGGVVDKRGPHVRRE